MNSILPPPILKYQGYKNNNVKNIRRKGDIKNISNEKRNRLRRNKDNTRIIIDRPLG